MAETDVVFTLGFDTKNLYQQLNDVRKEFERVAQDIQKSFDKIDLHVGNGNSRNGAALSIISEDEAENIDEATQRIQELESQLARAQEQIQILAETFREMMGDIQVTPEFQEIIDNMSELQTEGNELQETMAQVQAEMQDIADRGDLGEVIDASRLTELQEELDGLSARYEEINEQFREYEEEAMRMSESGEAFVLIDETAEELSRQIEELTARVAQLEAQSRQSNNTVNQTVRIVNNYSEAAQRAQRVTRNMFTNFNGGFTRVIRFARRGIMAIAGLVLGVRGLMGIWNKFRAAIKEGFKALYEGDKQFKKQVDDLKKSWSEVKANLAAAFLPIVEIAIPYIQKLIDWVNVLISKLAMFIAAISGQNAYTRAIKATADAASQANKQLSKLDELNVLSTNGSWSTEQVPIDNDMLEKVQKLKDLLAQIWDEIKRLMVNPFLDGLNVEELKPKFDKLKKNFEELGGHLANIFTDPRIQEAEEKYIQSVSKTLGKVTGAGTSIGLELGNLILTGLNQFLTEHEDEIAEKFSNMIGLKTELSDKIGQLADAFRKIFDGLSENQDAINAVKNCFDIIWEVMSTYGTTQLQVLVDLQTLSNAPFVNNIDEWRSAFDRLWDTLNKLSTLIDEITIDVSEKIQRITDAVSKFANEFLAPFIADVTTKILDLWGRIKPVVDEIIAYVKQIYDEYLAPIIEDIAVTVEAAVDVIIPVLEKLWKNYLSPFIDWIIAYIVPIIVPILKQAFQAALDGFKLILAITKPVFDAIKEFVLMVKAIMEGDWQDVWYHATKFLYAIVFETGNNISKWVIEKIGNLVKNLGEYLNKILILATNVLGKLFDKIVLYKNNFLSILNIIKTQGIQGLVNKFTSAWSDIKKNFIDKVKNGVADMVEGILQAVKELLEGFGEFNSGMTDIFTNFGSSVGSGFTNAVNALSNRLRFPRYATGQVIPPSMAAHLAVLGDNKTETEVVSPLSTMQEAMLNALQQSGFGGGEIHIHVDLDGREIAKSVVKQDNITRMSRGVGLFGT